MTFSFFVSYRFAGVFHLSLDALASFWENRRELIEKDEKNNTPNQRKKRKTASQVADGNAAVPPDENDNSDDDIDQDGAAPPDGLERYGSRIHANVVQDPRQLSARRDGRPLFDYTPGDLSVLALGWQAVDQYSP